MAEFYSVDLKGKIPGNGDVEFLEAVLPGPPYQYMPFATVHYTVGCVTPETNRLDLDKGVFLDEQGKPNYPFLQRSAPEIVRFIGKQRQERGVSIY